MTAFDSFLRAVTTVKTYHPTPFTHVILHPDNFAVLCTSAMKTMPTWRPWKLLGYELNIDPAVPRELVRFHSPACAGAAMVPWHETVEGPG